jgi:hypothetical protein
MKSVIQPKKPKGNDWELIQRGELYGYENFAYRHQSGLCVISAVEVASDHDDIDRGPEYHISISKLGRRCTSQEAKWVIRQFDAEGAEEDNHVPHGIVRNFWLPVAQKLIGVECPCKATEPVIREDKGDYIWRPVGR